MMKIVELLVVFSLSNNFAFTSSINLVNNGDNNGQLTSELYKTGVDMGIINPEKYPLKAFERDEQNLFRDMYKEYVSLYDDQVDYEEWVIMNNFGLLPDTQESFVGWNLTVTGARNKQNFINAVRTGDILIAGQGRGLRGAIVGHAAIMTTDNWVVEMPGPKQNGIKSNNRRISKSTFYDIHKSAGIAVYRCPNNAVAREAASWASRKYFNPSGGSTKTVHIDYKIDNKFSQVNPSYCSKLVIQAYHNGTGKKNVIDTKKLNTMIAPFGIPNYFLSPYKLRNVGKY